MSSHVYRGRTLEEILPQVRAELGPDAIVLARREGLAGGVGGFFQKPFVEVEARRGDDEDAADGDDEDAADGDDEVTRNDRATAEGLSSPAVQELLRQAAPFAEQLEARLAVPGAGPAPAPATPTLAEVLASAADAPAAAYTPSGGHAAHPRASIAAEPAPVPESPVASGATAAPAEAAPELHDVSRSDVAERREIETRHPVANEPEHVGIDAVEIERYVPKSGGRAATPRPNAAQAIENRLIASGLSDKLAVDVVGEAIAHGMPFAPGARQLRKVVRAAIARRIRVFGPLGPDARALAFVGPGGSGKTTLVAAIATAYANAGGHDVLVVALRHADSGQALERALAGAAELVVATSAEQASRRVRSAGERMVIVDCASAAPKDKAAITQLSGDLEALGVEEVHVTLPATLSASAARTALTAAKPLHPTHVALTRLDETDAPGAVVELCASAGTPLSYVAEADGVLPADPADLAARLLPS